MSFFANMFKAPAREDDKQSEQVLQNLRKRRGSETGKWLAMQSHQDLVNQVMVNGVLPPMKNPPKLEDVDKVEIDNSPAYEPPVEATFTPIASVAKRSESKQPQKGNAQVDWIENIFDEFARCATEFNRTNTVPTLMVTVFRPEYKYESSTFDTYVPEAKISVFKGHIATNKWGMLVQGHGNVIEIFVFPAENLLRYTLSDIRGTGFAPLMTINAILVSDQLEWHIEDQVVSSEKLPLLAKELFGDLIRIASGKMSDSELFANYSSGFKLGETIAQGYTPVDPGPVDTVAPLDQKLGTWTACRELVKAVGNDLAVVADREHTASDAGNDAQLQQLKQLSQDLRALSGGISDLLLKYDTIK
jgi:hypothetical protein